MSFPDWLPVYGQRNKDETQPETWHQKQFFSFIRVAYPNSYGRVAFHAKNESRRNYGQVYFDKSQGLTKGVSDIIIPGNPTFVCELKKSNLTEKTITSSKHWVEQLKYLETCRKLGAFVCLARGYKGAEQAFNEWKKNQVSN